MQFPDKVPEVVRNAVSRYVRLRRFTGLAVILITAVAGIACLLFAALMVDRFYESDPGWRSLWPWVIYAGLCATGLCLAGYVWCYRPSALDIAVALDDALPELEDRWASSIDLADRQASGEYVGSEACVAQLFTDTQAKTTDIDVFSVLRLRPLGIVGLVLAITGTLFLAVHLSSAFSLPLLWQRFWNPDANLPRDSFTVIEILDASGSDWTESGLKDLPEGSTFRLSVSLTRRATLFTPALDAANPVAPQVEIITASGGREVKALGRSGEQWRFRYPRLKEPFRFRIRAGDGVTAWYQQGLIQRIRLEELIHSVTYPKYARLENVKDETFTGKRLTALAGTRVSFELKFDGPATAYDVSFELLQKRKKKATAVLANQGRYDPRQEAEEKGGVRTSRRQLKTRRRGERTCRFRLTVEETGVLRLRAVGENGLASQERVIMIEALPDAPPRVSISGIAPETTILPGETISYQFRADDDYAVSDLVLERTSADWIASGDLTGEEYLSHKDLGQKVIIGKELIQRMNYPIYSTSPFEFRLLVIDSKGQEARSPTFKLLIVADNFNARFDRGMEYLEKCRRSADAYRGFHLNLANKLKIIRKVMIGQTNWPSAQNSLLEAYLKEARNVNHQFSYSAVYLQRFGGFPYRLDRSAALLTFPHRVLADHYDVKVLAGSLKGASDLPGQLNRLQKMHDQNIALAELWRKAARLEIERFQPESLQQKLETLNSRYASLHVFKEDRQLHTANLGFYNAKLVKLLASARNMEAVATQGAAEIKALEVAQARRDVKAIRLGLTAFVEVLSPYRSTPDPALFTLLTELQKYAAASSAARRLFEGAAGEFIRSCGQESLFSPFEILDLAAGSQVETASGNWHLPPVAKGDIRLIIDHLYQDIVAHQIDMLAGRHVKFPAAATDRDAGLRERLMSASYKVAQCSTLDPALKQEIISLLNDSSAHPLSIALVSAGNTLPDRFRKMLKAIAAAGDDDARLPSRRKHLSAALDRLAQAYHEHAHRCRVLADSSSEVDEAVRKARIGQLGRGGLRLMNRAEALDASARALIFLHIQQDPKAKIRAWDEMAPLHGLQLAITFAATRSLEHIAAGHAKGGGKKALLIIADRAEALANDLQAYAALSRQVFLWQKTDFDFEALMKASKARGYLQTLEDEFSFVGPLLKNASEAERNACREQLGKSKLGAVAVSENRLLELMASTVVLTDSGSSAGAVLDVLKRLSKVIPTVDIPDLKGEHEALARALQTLPPKQTLPSTDRRNLSSFVQRISGLIEELQSNVLLEETKGTAQMNRRAANSRGMPNLWIIQEIVDGHDRRWTALLRETELSLVRELAIQVLPGGMGPVHDKSLAYPYGRLIELRARNLANERRRNKGISFLGGDAGPSLRLPKHIAAEFYKARNMKPPAAFKAWNEAYYENLHKDLSE